MRISDWSSDVCSSDLANAGTDPQPNSAAVPASPADNSAFLYVVPGSSAVFPLEMATNSIRPAGGSQPHENMMPSLALNFIIALYGIFPRSEEHTSELQSLMRISYAFFCLKKKN